jgi:hypothetical protein
MNATVEIDTREFDAALKQYIAKTSKTLAEALNHQAGNLAVRAYVNTPKVTHEKIVASLGLRENVGRTQKKLARAYHKSGVGEFVKARAIFVWWLRKKGKLKETTGVTQKMLAWIASRLRSGKFMASGWLPAIKKLLPEKAGIDSKPGRKYGKAIKARDVLDAFAQIENNSSPKTRDKAVESAMVSALRAAFVETTADMKVYLTRKAQEAANTVNAVKK